MTDQPQPQPGAPGTSGAWQPVPGGGDYDPDQTMHVSFAAQLPPEPRPGEDPLGAHGPAGPPGESDPATQWSIPVIRDEVDADSGEFSVGAFAAPWDQAPSPAATQSFPAGMSGQGAAAAAAAQAQTPPAQQAPQGDQFTDPFTDRFAEPFPDRGAGRSADPYTGQWDAPFGAPAPAADPGLDPGTGLPWPAAQAAWSAVVDDPEGPAPYASPAHEAAADSAFGPGDQDSAPDEAARARTPGEPEGPADAGALRDPEGLSDGPGALESLGGLEALDGLDRMDGLTGFDALPGLDTLTALPARHEDGLAGDGGAQAAAEEAEDADEPDEEDEEPVAQTRSEHPLASYVLRVNGADRPVTDAWLGESLLYVLRERLGLAGAKDGCEQGECGACSVQVDGRLVASCLVPAATAAGSEVRTVEGLSVDGNPSDVQRALAESGAVQCGFCVPGLAMTVHDLLEGNHKPTDLETRQALCGNLCRCSGYRGVLDAVGQVVAAREAATDDDGAPPAGGARVPHQGGPTTPATPPPGGAA